MGNFDFILEFMKNRTPEEIRDSLIRAGIVDESGNLTDHYKTPKKSKKGSKKRNGYDHKDSLK